jgi:hypothetical protein
MNDRRPQAGRFDAKDFVLFVSPELMEQEPDSECEESSKYLTKYSGLRDEDRRVHAEYSVLPTLTRLQTGEEVRGAGTSCCDRRL